MSQSRQSDSALRLFTVSEVALIVDWFGGDSQRFLRHVEDDAEALNVGRRPSDHYGIAGRAAGEAVLEHGRDGARLRAASDAFLLSRIARAMVDAIHAPEDER